MNNFLAKFDYEYFFGTSQEFGYIKLYICFYLAIIIFAIATVFYLRYQLERNPITKSFKKKVFWGNLIFGLVGFFLIFLRDQRLPIFSTRIPGFLNIVLFISYNVYLFVHFRRTLTRKLYIERDRKRIEKWLPKKKKK